MADVSFQIEGVNSLVAKLGTVSDDIRFRGGRFALRKAANLIRDKAKANAERLNDPETPADISKNIAVRWSSRTFKRTGNLGFRVGVMGGANQYANTRANVRAGRAGGTYLTDGSSGNPGGDTFHWRYLEFGTAKMPAQPFMRPALADNISAATSEFVKHYDKALDRAIKRAAKKAKG